MPCDIQALPHLPQTPSASGGHSGDGAAPIPLPAPHPQSPGHPIVHSEPDTLFPWRLRSAWPGFVTSGSPPPPPPGGVSSKKMTKKKKEPQSQAGESRRAKCRDLGRVPSLVPGRAGHEPAASFPVPDPHPCLPACFLFLLLASAQGKTLALAAVPAHLVMHRAPCGVSCPEKSSGGFVPRCETAPAAAASPNPKMQLCKVTCK